jgi:signal transduction histidine kinase
MPIMLFLAALVPAVCVLWFMTIAMRNERLAVQQELTSVYVSHLNAVQRQLTSFWREKQSAAKSLQAGAPGEIFSAIVRSNIADSAIVHDSARQVLYPVAAATNFTVHTDEQPGWPAARELEFQKTNYVTAAEAYERIARESSDIHVKARAIQSRASCLAKAGEKLRAIQLLDEMCQHAELQSAIGSQGTLTVPNAQLMLLKLANDPCDPIFAGTLRRLTERLNDYGDAHLGASQRRFLMEELSALRLSFDRPDPGVVLTLAPIAGEAARNTRERVLFPTLIAEQMAAEYLERNVSSPIQSGLQLVAEGIYRLATPDRTCVLLFRESKIIAETKVFFRDIALPDVSLRLIRPEEREARASWIPLQSAGELMPGWQLALAFNGADPFEAAWARQVRMYLWTGTVVIFITGLLTLLVARFVSAQLRLTQVKDDLVSTVSHELKTPLASMRALVDTLRAGRYRDESQLQAYLGLISKENQRLSHLIENFLSFSRMERKKQRFRLEETEVAQIVDGALAPLRDRLVAPNCRFEIDLAHDLPTIRADREAITTALINLLENAWKYTPGDKQIQLKAYRSNGAVTFDVHDNGIGITTTEAKKIFDRFYQVDQSLTRKASGCGLGLSIVQFIVKGHGGSIDVASQPGKGSTFTMRLPVGSGAAREDG